MLRPRQHLSMFQGDVDFHLSPSSSHFERRGMDHRSNLTENKKLWNFEAPKINTLKTRRKIVQSLLIRKCLFLGLWKVSRTFVLRNEWNLFYTIFFILIELLSTLEFLSIQCRTSFRTCVTNTLYNPIY